MRVLCDQSEAASATKTSINRHDCNNTMIIYRPAACWPLCRFRTEQSHDTAVSYCRSHSVAQTVVFLLIVKLKVHVFGCLTRFHFFAEFF